MQLVKYTLNLFIIIGLGIYFIALSSFTINSIQNFDSDDAPKDNDQGILIQPSEFAIVTYYAPQKNNSHIVNHSKDLYMKVANITLTNLARYSQKHGHAFFFMNGNMVDTNSKSAYWGKMNVLEYYLNKGYKWVLWTDIDVLFMNFSMSIFEEWIRPVKKSTHLLFVNECIPFKESLGPIRSGFFAVRNSHQGRSFLQAWRETFDDYKSIRDPEQHALEDMIKEEKWFNISEISSHSLIHTYPQCYNGSTISVHFPGRDKRLVESFSHKVNASVESFDFVIAFPGI